MGTLIVMYSGYIKGLLTFDDLVDDLNRLTKFMWVSTDVVTEIIKKAKEVKKQ